MKALACKTVTHDVINAASFHVCAYSVVLPGELQLSLIVYGRLRTHPV